MGEVDADQGGSLDGDEVSQVITAHTLWEAGFRDLVCVIPPGASVNPASGIVPGQLGKVPGHLRQDGTWTGYAWQTHAPERGEVLRWMQQGANIGLRAEHFPAVDIDVLDAELASAIENLARLTMGPAPTRVGLAPKRLLLYRTATPFARMRMRITEGNTEHLIEVLAKGQQFLVAGRHPSGSVYQWSRDALRVEELEEITEAKCEAFFAAVEELLKDREATWRYEGGRTQSAAATDQLSLRAPSFDAVASIMEKMPNTDALFPNRSHYLAMGYALKASVGPEHEYEGLQLFAAWAKRWDHGTKHNDLDVVAADWKRMHAPFATGWGFLVDMAAKAGVHVAQEVFDVIAERPDPVVERREELAPTFGTEHWLAWRALHLIGPRLRFVPQQGKWYVWNSTHWVPDSIKLAEAEVNGMLVREAKRIVAEAEGDAEREKRRKVAASFQTAQRSVNVRRLLESDRNIALDANSLDSDPWILNTPSGVIDLKTGNVSPCDPGLLCSRITATGMDRTPPVTWLRFLHDACGGDERMVTYLQKVAGYCLTGDTTEQTFWFIWGPGGNGKSLFLGTLHGVLKDYATTMASDTLTASNGDKHSTDLAMLAGARFVYTGEVAAGKRWDEERLKRLTGDGPVTARFMRQDNFVFTPQFKLLIAGNHQPVVRDVDAGLKRRMRLIPFTHQPPVIDPQLFDKLRLEWPQILGWAVEGSLMWQRDGMQTPETVRLETSEYFEEEDVFQQFLDDCCRPTPGGVAYTENLFSRWREWANAHNVYIGDQKRLAGALRTRGYERVKVLGKRGFSGLTLADSTLEVFA